MSDAPDVDIRVELKLGGVWTDITTYVLARDRVRITRGRSDEASTVDPGRCQLTLDNEDGRFSMRNPTGPYYGQLARNTPLRVSVIRDGTTFTRFVGEVAAWPSQWQPGGIDRHVLIEAAGVLRRLSQGSRNLQSPMYRQTMADQTTVAYWPCEDDSDAQRLASALDGGDPMSIKGDVQPATYSGFAASEPVPLLKTGSLRGPVGTYPDTDVIQLRWLMHIPEAGPANDQTIITAWTSGRPVRWQVRHPAADALQVVAFHPSGDIVLDTGNLTGHDPDGNDLYCSLELTANGTDTDWALSTLQPGETTGKTSSGTYAASGQVDTVTQVRVAPGHGLGDVAIGHISVHDQITSIFDLHGALNGWDGESAGRRIERLCAEEGVPFRNIGHLDDTEPMGPQRTEAFLGILHGCADADQGILYETREEIGLTYRTSFSLYNQGAL